MLLLSHLVNLIGLMFNLAPDLYTKLTPDFYKCVLTTINPYAQT